MCTKHWVCGWRKRSAVMQHFIQSLLSESHMMLNALRGVSQKVIAAVEQRLSMLFFGGVLDCVGF